MALFTIEHTKTAYLVDFALHGIAIAALVAYLMRYAPSTELLTILSLVMLGFVSWSGVEYVIHRYVLHGLQPFRRWHTAHHGRPMALICTPTALSVSLITALVFLPILLVGEVWLACSLTLGMLTGYLAYAVTHHAVHHWHADSRWLRERKRWHALHHYVDQHHCYGVTSNIWDRIFGTTHQIVTRSDY